MTIEMELVRNIEVLFIILIDINNLKRKQSKILMLN